MITKTIGVLVPGWYEITEIVHRQFGKEHITIIPEKLENCAISLDKIDILVIFSGVLRKKHIEQMPNLKFVQTLTSGIDNIDTQLLTKRNILLADNNGINANSVAEHTLSLMLSLTRSLFLLNQSIKAGMWQGPPPHLYELHELRNKTIGIIGLGRIGQLVAKKLESFDVTLIYNDIEHKPVFEKEHNIQYETFETLLELSDVITIHVPLTDKTFHMINAKTMKLMKKKPFIINTSRGSALNTKLLPDALENGYISGAGIDVFESEPLNDYDIHLLNHPQIFLTPHRAGSSIENWEKRIAFAFENIQRFLNTETPISLCT